MSARISKPIAIGLLDWPGAQQAALLGLSDLLQTAGDMARQSGKQEVVPGVIRHEDGYTGLDAMVVAPVLSTCIDTAFPHEEALLRQFHDDGGLVCSVCAGAFLLGEAGLLDGRRATTHWRLADQFRQRFPNVDLQPDAMLIDDWDIMTAGGLMAWTDLGLRLVERFSGTALMMEVARLFLLDPPRREQRFYSRFVPAMDHGDAAILTAQKWAQQHFAEPVSNTDLAEQAGLAERSFLRRFVAATGEKPKRYIQLLRLNKARDLLEDSMMPVADICWQTGYQDPAAFARLFNDIVGLSPGEYRRRFGRASGAGFPVEKE